MTPHGRTELRIGRLANRQAALGAACHFLARRAPFGSFPAEALVRTLNGQVARGHYLLAVEGERVVGWLGWALLSDEAARRCATAGAVPSEAELAAGGEVVWALTAAASGPGVLAALARAARRENPGRRVLGVRHRPGGPSALLDTRSPRRRLGSATSGA